MVTWSDVCRWSPEPLAQAAESLGRAAGSLTSIRGEAQSARTRVASEAPSVTAARGAQGRCEARHGELIGRVRGMHRATWDACDGVAMVRRSVLACQDWTARCFSDTACLGFQAAFVKFRSSRSTSFGVRYPRAE